MPEKGIFVDRVMFGTMLSTGKDMPKGLFGRTAFFVGGLRTPVIDGMRILLAQRGGNDEGGVFLRLQNYTELVEGVFRWKAPLIAYAYCRTLDGTWHGTPIQSVRFVTQNGV